MGGVSHGEEIQFMNKFDYLRYLIYQSYGIAVEIVLAVSSILLLIQFIKSKLRK